MFAPRRNRYAEDPLYRERVKARARLRHAQRTAEDRAGYNAERGLYNRLRKFQITLAEFDAMIASQGQRCAICKSSSPGRKPGQQANGRTWAIDHDHKTGKVRGLLCMGCNAALGHAKDDPALLMAMIEYLSKSTK